MHGLFFADFQNRFVPWNLRKVPLKDILKTLFLGESVETAMSTMVEKVKNEKKH